MFVYISFNNICYTLDKIRRGILSYQKSIFALLVMSFCCLLNLNDFLCNKCNKKMTFKQNKKNMSRQHIYDLYKSILQNILSWLWKRRIVYASLVDETVLFVLLLIFPLHQRIAFMFYLRSLFMYKVIKP